MTLPFQFMRKKIRNRKDNRDLHPAALHLNGMGFTFQHLFNTKDYAKSVVVTGQLLSLRVNTLSPADLVVSDLSGSESYDIHENRPEIPPEHKKSLLLYADKLSDFATKYFTRTGAALFDGSDVDREKSSFIELFHKYCFVRLRVRLAVGRDPLVTGIDLVSACVQFEELWSRFRDLVGHLVLDKDLLVKMIKPALRVDQYDFLLSPPPLDSTSYSSQDSSQVKIEPDIKSETGKEPSQSYAFFSAALAPSQVLQGGQTQTTGGQEVQEFISLETNSSKVASLETDSSKDDSRIDNSSKIDSRIVDSSKVDSGVSDSSKIDSREGDCAKQTSGANEHSSSQFYLPDRQALETQIFFPSQNEHSSHSQDLLTQVPQTIDPETQFLRRSPVFSTQESQLDFESSRVSITIQGSSSGSKVSLSHLNKKDVENDHYKVQAQIVGTVPHDLCLVCTKSYMEVNGEVVLSDPKMRSFDIILVDSPDKNLGPHNSLSVHVPSSQVLSFFGYKHTEQLYTRMEALKEEFSALYFTDLEFEVSRSTAYETERWTLDTTLKNLKAK